MSSNPRVPLSYHVFVAPEKPFNGPAPRVGDSPAWDPTTSTLILGARGPVLFDPLATVREGTALGDWVAPHGAPSPGLSVLLDPFPEARAVAPGTTETARRRPRPSMGASATGSRRPSR